MQKFFGLPQYSLAVAVIYLLVSPFLFLIVYKTSLHYSFSYASFPAVLMAIIFSISVFTGYLFWKFGLPNLKPVHILKATLYGLIIAVPEEIIFRGIIQNYIKAYFDNTSFVIFLSSLVYGLVHLPNGAKNIHLSGWNWKFAALAFSAGLPLGFIFSLTNNLLLPTLLHAFFIVCLQLFNKWRNL